MFNFSYFYRNFYREIRHSRKKKEKKKRKKKYNENTSVIIYTLSDFSCSLNTFCFNRFVLLIFFGNEYEYENMFILNKCMMLTFSICFHSIAVNYFSRKM